MRRQEIKNRNESQFYGIEKFWGIANHPKKNPQGQVAKMLSGLPEMGLTESSFS